MGRPSNRVYYLLRTEVVQDHIDRRRLRHRDVASELGVTPGHWSALVHRRRGVTASLRARILASTAFEGTPGDALWERVERGAA